MGISAVVFTSFRGPVISRGSFSVLCMSASCGWNSTSIFVSPRLIVWGVVLLFGRGGFSNISAGILLFSLVVISIFTVFPVIVLISIFEGSRESFLFKVLEVWIVAKMSYVRVMSGMRVARRMSESLNVRVKNPKIIIVYVICFPFSVSFVFSFDLSV